MKTTKATKTRLLMLAAGKGLNMVWLYIAIWDMVLAVLCAMGKMNPLVIIATLIVIDVVIFAALLHNSFRAKYVWENVRAMRGLLKNKAVIARVMGKPLTYENGAWGYSDDELFVRVNETSACILCASELDLEKPCLHYKQRTYDTGKQLYAQYLEYNMFEFRKRDGGSMLVRTDKVVPLQDWLTARGGRIKLMNQED